jgi:hypothetical protein
VKGSRHVIFGSVDAIIGFFFAGIYTWKALFFLVIGELFN